MQKFRIIIKEKVIKEARVRVVDQHKKASFLKPKAPSNFILARVVNLLITQFLFLL